MDKLLDRLTHEIHPTVLDQVSTNHVEKDKSDDENKERLVKEGKLKAEVRAAVGQYEEKLQGNSKLLQDISGKINQW